MDFLEEIKKALEETLLEEIGDDQLKVMIKHGVVGDPSTQRHAHFARIDILGLPCDLDGEKFEAALRACFSAYFTHEHGAIDVTGRTKH